MDPDIPEEQVMPTKSPKNQAWTPYNVARFEIPIFTFLPREFYRFRWGAATVGLRRIFPFSMVTLGQVIFLIVPLAVLGLACYVTRDDEESSGSVASFVLVFVYILSMRHSVFTFLLGISFERLLFWHKLCARISVVVGCYHGWVSQEWDVTGIILTSLMAALCVLAFFPIRRYLFEFFYRTHWVLFLAVIVADLAHSGGGALVACACWGFDILCRAFVVVRNYKKTKHLKCTTLPAGVIRLSWKKQNFTYKSGQYVFICIPSLSYFEWHPFSISSSPHQDDVCVHIRVLGNWTKQLHKLVTSKKLVGETELIAYVEGPYGTTAVDVDSAKYTNFLFVSGGIGITPLQSICNDLLAQHQDGRPLKHVDFIWSVRDRFMISAVTDDNKPYLSHDTEVLARCQDGAAIPYSFSPDLVVRESAAATRVLNAEYYLTKCRRNEDFADANIRPEVQPFLKFGRPNLNDIFTRAAKQAESGRVAVLVCGPNALVRDVGKMCAKHSSICGTKNVQFDFHDEIFEF